MTARRDPNIADAFHFRAGAAPVNRAGSELEVVLLD
jgi:hypothetical protein